MEDLGCNMQLTEVSDRCLRCLCMFYLFLHGSIQLGVVFCSDLLFLVNKLQGSEMHISRWKFHIMFRLFPKISIVLDQTDIFKTSIVAQLNVYESIC